MHYNIPKSKRLIRLVPYMHTLVLCTLIILSVHYQYSTQYILNACPQ